jgi:hypothetical protein
METRWGKRFGRYEVVAELGRGAMGVVYKARDPKIDRFVAVKTISMVGHVPEEQREYRERFIREAQAAGRLLHSGIVTIFDVGDDSDTQGPYLVMEYVAGIPLHGMLADGVPIPLDSALRLTQQIAEALDYAHAQNIVHRDIKPANIMVTAEGQAKITDFGIAKLNLTHLTVPGRVFGTPAYMSPEQLDGGPVDGRTDIFALGVILYSMVTGYRPFQGNSVMTVCFKVANREPMAPTLLDPNLPPEVDAVIARAMAKNPANRYQRGMELALDLGELLGRGPASQLTGGFTRREQASGMDSGHQFASALLARARSLIASRAIVVSVCITVALAWLAMRGPMSIGRAPTISPAVDAMIAPGRPLRTTPGAAIRSPHATAPSSTLEVEIEHRFKDGKISVWVDGSLEYVHSLRSEGTRHFLIFQRTRHRVSQKLSLSPGMHRIGVRAQSQPDAYDQHREVSCTLAPGTQKILRVSFNGPRQFLRLGLK